MTEISSSASSGKTDASLDLPLLASIPAGRFWLGASPGDSQALDVEKPGREVYLSEYKIGCYPVTNKQYAQFVEAANHPGPQYWVGREVPAGIEDHPVVMVSSADAYEYCLWLSQETRQTYRLPTEAEWEKAARGLLPDKRCYVWGDQWRVCNTKEFGRQGTTSVYEFEATNISPFGIVDLLGNVWEWTSSRYGPYPGTTHDSSIYEQDYRVVRGGSWNRPAREARISCRGRYSPETRRAYVGFRVVVDGAAQPAAAEYQPKVDRVALHNTLTEYFNLEELRTLCFDLNIGYDNLPGEGLTPKPAS